MSMGDPFPPGHGGCGGGAMVGPDVKFYPTTAITKAKLHDRTVDVPGLDATGGCGVSPADVVVGPAPMGGAYFMPRSEAKGVADGAGGGVKADTGKPVFDLLPVESLAEIARVLEFGAKKYDAWNWSRGMKWLRLWNACIRHLFAWVAGENIDPETGLSHLAHAGCCILFMLSYEQTGRGEDDRRKR